MLLAVAHKECLQLWRDGRLIVLALSIAALSLMSIVIDAAAQRRAAAEREAASELDRSLWANQGEINPHSAAHFGQFAFKPASPLGSFDRGVAPFLGEAIWIEAHYQNPAQASDAETDTSLQRFGDLSFAWILLTLLPLLLILCGFAIVAGERERRSLHLQLAQGLSSAALVGGKALGICVVAGLMLTPLLLITGGVAAAAAGPADLRDTAIRWLGIVAAYAIYIAIWIAITCGVSAFAKSARQALVVLLALWAASIVLVPRFAAEYATRAHPMMSAGEFWAAVSRAQKEGIDGHDPTSARTVALRKSVLEEYGVDDETDLPISFTGIALQAGEEHGNEVYDRFYGELQARERRQVRAQRWFSILTPAIAVRSLSAGLAGNDLVHHRDFAREVEYHRRAIQVLLNRDLTVNGKKMDLNYRANPDFWRSVPTFTYDTPSFSSVARSYLEDFAIALLWLVLSVAFAAAGARHLRRGG